MNAAPWPGMHGVGRPLESLMCYIFCLYRAYKRRSYMLVVFSSHDNIAEYWMRIGTRIRTVCFSVVGRGLSGFRRLCFSMNS